MFAESDKVESLSFEAALKELAFPELSASVIDRLNYIEQFLQEKFESQ